MKMRKLGTFLCAVAVVSPVLLTGCTTEMQKLNTQLKDKDSAVRWQAADKLGQTGKPQAVAPLIAALGDKEVEVRNAAADALGKLGKPAVKPLVASLASKNVETKQLVLIALGAIRDKSTVGPICALLKDKSAALRRQSATVLGKIASVDAITALRGALNDSDKDVQAAVKGALAEIKKQEDLRIKRQAELKKQQAAKRKRIADQKRKLEELKKKQAAKAAKAKADAKKKPAVKKPAAKKSAADKPK